MVPGHGDVLDLDVLVLPAPEREVDLGPAVERDGEHYDGARHVFLVIDGLQNHVVRVGDVDVDQAVLAPRRGVAALVGVAADLALEVLEGVRLDVVGEGDLHLGFEPGLQTAEVDVAHAAQTLARRNQGVLLGAVVGPAEAAEGLLLIDVVHLIQLLLQLGLRLLLDRVFLHFFGYDLDFAFDFVHAPFFLFFLQIVFKF